jgi:hypothetical protein
MAVIQNEAKASYVAVGRRQIIEQTIWQIPWWRIVDPLAQTFNLTEDRYVTAVGLYFATKDPSQPVTVQLRNVVNGYPGPTVLASRTLRPEEVITSADGTAETKVALPDPVLVQANTEYAIAIITPSSQYRVFVARMGAKDIRTGQVVARQPYTVGVMFSSSNGTAWTAHQDMDLKLRLYAAKFANEAILAFQPVPVSQVSKLVLATSQLVPRGAAIAWEWSPDGQQWFALASDDVTELGNPMDTIYLRARLQGVPSVSPVVQPGAVTLIAMKHKASGVYVSRQITSQPFTTITVYMDMYTPSGTSQAMKYSVDGVNWVSFGNPVSQQQVDAQFVQYKYQATLSQPATQLRVRIEQSTNSPLVTPRARRLMVLLS